jgi:hypothetical protein
MSFVKQIAGAALSATLPLGSSLISSPAQAAYVVTLEEVGGNVVATGSGAIDLTGLNSPSTSFGFGAILPTFADIITGPESAALVTI